MTTTNITPDGPDENEPDRNADDRHQSPAPGRAGGKRRQEGLSDHERSDLGRRGAAARWAGHLSPGQTERASRAVLAQWAALANLDLARPSREDVPVDELITPQDLDWIAPVQVKGIAADGMTVRASYLGQPIVLVYIWLGADDGGPAHRAQTTMAVLDPQTAWSLPSALGLAHDETSATYRWPRVTRSLNQALEPFTARTPVELAHLLGEAATHRPEPAGAA